MRSQKYLLDLVLNKGNCLFNLAQFLKTDNGNNFMKVSNLVVKNDDLNKKIASNYFPKDLSSTVFPTYLNGLSLYKTLLWYCSQLKTYSNDINNFLKHKESFEQYILTKQYQDAINILNEVERNFGLSLWLVESYCLLEELFEQQPLFVEKLDVASLNFYCHFKGKCNTKDPFFSYNKRVRENLDDAKVDKESHAYYNYKLFLTPPETDEEWKNILLIEGMYSLIDIYITVVNCLQHYFSKSIYNKKSTHLTLCYKTLYGLSCPVCQIMYNLLIETDENVLNNVYSNDYLAAFESNNHKKVVEMFFSNDSNLWNSFVAYRFAATSLLILNEKPEKTNGMLANEIVQLIFDILRKNENENLKNSIERLSVLARILHSFSIHKGICIFLRIVANNNYFYSFHEQYNSIEDIYLINYEVNSDNEVLLPFKCIYCKPSEEHITTIERILETQSTDSYVYNYYKEAYYRLKILKNIESQNLSEATSLLVESYIKNMFLIYTMNTDEVSNNIRKKLIEFEPLSLEELCFVFIDNDFSEYKIDCFLNFLDNNDFGEPLDITKSSYNSELVCYLLYDICNQKLLSKIYWLFDSAEEVKEYRLRICNYLLSGEQLKNNKELKIEIEELTKNLELKKRLRDVDKSRVFVDVRDIYKKTYEDIDNQVEIFNSISPNTYAQPNDKENVFYCKNPRLYILEQMYLIYTREFCFSISGIDTSLSTRVRHGSLSNQVLRTLADNSLAYNSHDSNKLFKDLKKNNDITKEINSHLHVFNFNVNQKLEYLRQHILKVFVDEPIEGAVFDYSLSMADKNYLFEVFENVEKTNTEKVISILNNMLITKTNCFLVTIKEEVLPDLLNSLIDECNKFNERITPYIKENSAQQSIGKKITDCKVALNSEINTISEWFSLNDSDNWDDFTFDDLIDMCFEIEKKLFSEFESIKINKCKDHNFVFKGDIFRQCIDIVLMLFNNAIQHSGFIGQLSNLEIDFSIKSDNSSIYLIVENNLSETIDKDILNLTIQGINNNYKEHKYLTINTRQEGGMGLLKVMSILFSATQTYEQFYVSLHEGKFRVEIKIKKEIVLDEKNLNS